MTCQLGPERFPPKMIGWAFTVSRGVFRIFVSTGGVYSEFCPVSLKMAPFHTIGAFTRIITGMYILRADANPSRAPRRGVQINVE